MESYEFDSFLRIFHCGNKRRRLTGLSFEIPQDSEIPRTKRLKESGYVHHLGCQSLKLTRRYSRSELLSLRFSHPPKTETKSACESVCESLKGSYVPNRPPCLFFKNRRTNQVVQVDRSWYERQFKRSNKLHDGPIRIDYAAFRRLLLGKRAHRKNRGAQPHKDTDQGAGRQPKVPQVSFQTGTSANSNDVDQSQDKGEHVGIVGARKVTVEDFWRLINLRVPKQLRSGNDDVMCGSLHLGVFVQLKNLGFCSSSGNPLDRP